MATPPRRLAETPDFTTPVRYLCTVYAKVKNLVLLAAEKMPTEQYSFRPVPEVRTFAQILGHIADAQYYFASGVLRESNPAPKIEASRQTKLELTAALREAFVYSDQAYALLTEANAADLLEWPGEPGRARLGALMFNVAHAYEHYGYLATYLRLQRIVPPSSEPRP